MVFVVIFVHYMLCFAGDKKKCSAVAIDEVCLDSAADFTGLYKVIFTKRWIPPKNDPKCLSAKLTLRDSRHFRGHGNMGAISAQAASAGQTAKYGKGQYKSRVEGENQ